jgi:hypothetical protein
MRASAVLVLLGSVAASCSGGNDRAYAFNDALRCFRSAGYQAVIGEETSPPTPETRDFEVWDNKRLVYALIFFDSVAQAKEERGGPPILQPPGFPQGETARRGNVKVLTWRESILGEAGPGDRKTLDRCLPEE